MSDFLVLQDINLDENSLDKGKYTIFQLSQIVKPCVGCFGCWLKTPGKCVIKDNDSTFGIIMPHVKGVIVISELVFGGFSPNIKAIFDRSIGFILPFFCNVNGEMHHKQRYKKRPDLTYMFYGQNCTQAEKDIAQKLTKANAINFGADNYSTLFYNSFQEILEELK